MRILSPALLLLVVTSVAASAADAPPAAPEPPARPPTLKGADCLDPTDARGWQYVDSNELLVDAGRRKYRIRLAEFCTDLGHTGTIGFQGAGLTGRVCGHVGERVVLRRPLGTREQDCRIDTIELIDAETYRQAENRKRGSVSAGEAKR